MNISSLTHAEYLAIHGSLSTERAEELIWRVNRMTRLIDLGGNVANEAHCLQKHLDDVGGKLDELQALIGSMIERFAELKLSDNDDYGLMADIEDAHIMAREVWSDIAESASREELIIATKKFEKHIKEVDV